MREVVQVGFGEAIIVISGLEMPPARRSGRSRLRHPCNCGLRDAARKIVQPIPLRHPRRCPEAVQLFRLETSSQL
eukprot:2796684-Pyramimonas_sp.AAC.1